MNYSALPIAVFKMRKMLKNRYVSNPNRITKIVLSIVAKYRKMSKMSILRYFFCHSPIVFYRPISAKIAQMLYHLRLLLYHFALPFFYH